jgi:hypothetical protein
MKEKQATPERLIVIDINLTRGLVVALSCVVVLGVLLTCLTLTGDSASASGIGAAPAASTGMRQFYLTMVNHDGSEASTACAEGYHMASFWEIIDPSNLKYNTTLGFGRPDSGSGPPAELYGWVRTGNVNQTSSTTGQANCDGWSSNDSSHYGTVVGLPGAWTAGYEDFDIWMAGPSDCQWEHPTWCIED